MTEIYAAIGSILGFAVVLIARDLRDGKSLWKRNTDSSLEKLIREVLKSQGELRQYYNHDQTEILNKIHQEIQGHGSKLDILVTKQQIILDRLMK